MKILLASSPHADTFGYSMPPPGLLRLGGALRDAGHAPLLEDLSYRLGAGDIDGGDQLAASAAELLKGRGTPDVFGLSVMGATLPVALEIARLLREEWRGIPFLLGGPGIHGVDEDVLKRFQWIDGIVRGEGEITVPELLTAWGDRRELVVDGVTYRDADGHVTRAKDRPMIRDLNELPDYAWDLLPPLVDYKRITGEGDGLVPIDSGRGCVYDCSFCSIGRTWSRRSRPLPAARLADEVASLRSMPGARRAYLCHDIFGADRAHALAFIAELARRRIDVPWEVRARADHLDAELLVAMGQAGCDRVLLGIESASPRVRERNQKGMRTDIDLLGVIDDCAAAGVTPILSMILGLPGEEDEDLEASLRFCAEAALRAGVNLSLHLVNPQPGCVLGEEFGSRSKPVEGIPPDMALGAGLSAAERALIEAHPDLFSTWALLPYGVERLQELVFLSADLPEALMRYPRTFAQLLLLTQATNGPSSTPTLDLARAWRHDGRTFATFAREAAAAAEPADRAAIEELLGWESRLVRVAARGPRRPDPVRHRLGAEIFESRIELGSATGSLIEALQSGAEPPLRMGSLTTFAVAALVPRPGGLGQVRTMRLGDGALRLATALADASTCAAASEKVRSSQSLRNAVDQLIDEGILVAPGPPEGATGP